VIRVPLPGRLQDMANNPPEQEVQPRQAATIVVVRDGAHGIEAYLMRRMSSMSFAAGMYVFPGGGLTQSDSDPSIGWFGPAPSVWAERFSCSEDLARGLVVAAIRETFEETGILLAGPDGDTVVSDTSGAQMEAARVALDAGELSFADFLASHGWVLRADLLGAWAHWITPKFQPKRFDTKFFVAVLPEGQSVGSMSREADKAAWIPLSKALEAVDAGEAQMMPPTITACREVAQHTAGTLLAASAKRKIFTVVPQLVEEDGQLYLETDLGPNA
jgi:8-oxo-dGTP pyrophosphatase MutT (NUDIX family)